MKEKQTAEILQAWFDSNESNKNKYNQSPVGKTIKSNLQKTGHWKELARWHPPHDEIERNRKKHAGVMPKKGQIKETEKDDW